MLKLKYIFLILLLFSGLIFQKTFANPVPIIPVIIETIASGGLGAAGRYIFGEAAKKTFSMSNFSSRLQPVSFLKRQYEYYKDINDKKEDPNNDTGGTTEIPKNSQNNEKSTNIEDLSYNPNEVAKKSMEMLSPECEDCIDSATFFKTKPCQKVDKNADGKIKGDESCVDISIATDNAKPEKGPQLIASDPMNSPPASCASPCKEIQNDAIKPANWQICIEIEGGKKEGDCIKKGSKIKKQIPAKIDGWQTEVKTN